jgi:hypothetical protein
MKPKALADPHPRTLDLLFSRTDLEQLRSLVRLTAWEGSRMPVELVDRHLPDAAVVIGQTDLPRERLERAKRLKAIINVEGNFQPNVDYESCFERGIHVLGVGVAFGTAVAEMALGMALALARGIPGADRLFRQGKEVYGRFSNQDSFLLSGAEVGLIGFGNLGRSLSELLEPFRCAVRVYDPWLPPRWLAERGLVPASLDDVMSRSQSQAPYGQHPGGSGCLPPGAFRQESSPAPARQCHSLGPPGGKPVVGLPVDGGDDRGRRWTDPERIAAAPAPVGRARDRSSHAQHAGEGVGARWSHPGSARRAVRLPGNSQVLVDTRAIPGVKRATTETRLLP